MWILLRLIAMAIGFVVRLLTWSRRREDNDRIHGLPYSEVTSTHKGRVTSFELSVPLDTGLVFVFTPEGGADRLYKRIGLTEEFQTGDDAFDRSVYVGSDHPALLNILREDPVFREIVAQALAAGFQRVWSDGRRLFAVSVKKMPSGEWVQKLTRLRRAIEIAAARAPSRFADPFAARVLVVEAVLWSLAGYAAIAFFQMFGDVGSHFDGSRLVILGCLASLPAFGVMVWAVFAFLQRSSRSHRVLVESQILLMLSLPVLGVQTVADINRRFDAAPPVLVEARVEEKWTTTSRRRRGGARTHYHVELTSRGEPALPSPLKVPVGIYSSLVPGRSIEVGTGRLGFPYFRAVNGVDW